MNMLGICAVFCLMIIYAIDVCDAECEEYVVVFEEITCPSHVKLTPLKRRDINWDMVQGYPCNSTDKNPGNNKCVVEFDCLGTPLVPQCDNQITKVNDLTHSFINNHTAKPITSTTEAFVVPKSNINVEKKLYHTVEEEFNSSTYDLNVIYNKGNVIQNISLTTTKNCTLYCDYAETVCIDGRRLENYSFSDVKNVHTLEITINRDKTSPVQPLFTGYFPESSNYSSTNYINHFKYLNIATLSCPILKYNNCKQNIGNKSSKQINVFIKTNCIENNTVTKYPNCTKNSITSENVFNLKCEDTLFAKHNPQIIQTPPIPPPKQELSTWICHIFYLNDTLLSKEQRSENSKLYFKNCANDVSINNSKNKSGDNNVTPISDGKNRTIDSISTTIETIDSTKDVITRNKTEMPSGKFELNKENLSQTNTENMIKIVVTDKTNNCSYNSSLNIDEGKIIDLGANNNEKKFIQNNIIELKLSSCRDVNYSINNETQPDSKVELTIILKSESLNDSNLKQFNGTAKVGSVTQRILLRCDHPNLDSNNTVLQCELLDLDLYNITGIEISTNVSPISNVNNTKQNKKENLKMVEENHNQTKVNAEVNKNNNFSTNKTIEKNESTFNIKSNETNIKVVDDKEVEKSVPEGNNEVVKNNTNVVRNKEVQKKISESKEMSTTLNLNRKKDIPNGAGQSSLALGSPETEKILLIAILTIASVAILILIALISCRKKKEYNPAATREPPDEEETAF